MELHDESNNLLGTFEIERQANMNQGELEQASRRIRELTID